MDRERQHTNKLSHFNRDEPSSHGAWHNLYPSDWQHGYDHELLGDIASD